MANRATHVENFRRRKPCQVAFNVVANGTSQIIVVRTHIAHGIQIHAAVI